MKFTFTKMVSLAVLTAMMVSSTAILSADAASQIVIYQKYICSTNTAIKYPLAQQDGTSATQTYGLVGPDNRIRGGNDGIVRLSNGGTGFIVDDHTIATAAHCVNVVNASPIQKAQYESSHYYISDIQIQLYNADGTPKNTSLNAVEIHIPYEYVDVGYSRSNDFALITVAEDLSAYSHFDLGVAYNQNSTEFSNIDIFVTGIPQWTGDPLNKTYNRENLVFTGKGNEYAGEISDSDTFNYTTDTIGGNSGSPVYTACRYTTGNDPYSVIYTAVAIHCGGGGFEVSEDTYLYNEGSPITSSKIQFYLNNNYISY